MSTFNILNSKNSKLFADKWLTFKFSCYPNYFIRDLDRAITFSFLHYLSNILSYPPTSIYSVCSFAGKNLLKPYPGENSIKADIDNPFAFTTKLQKVQSKKLIFATIQLFSKTERFFHIFQGLNFLKVSKLTNKQFGIRAHRDGNIVEEKNANVRLLASQEYLLSITLLSPIV